MQTKQREPTTELKTTGKWGSKSRPNDLIITPKAEDNFNAPLDSLKRRLSPVSPKILSLPPISPHSLGSNHIEQFKRRSFLGSPSQESYSNASSNQLSSPMSLHNPNIIKPTDGDYLGLFRQFIENKAVSCDTNASQKKQFEKNLTLGHQAGETYVSTNKPNQNNSKNNVENIITEGMNRNITNAVRKFFNKIKSRKNDETLRFSQRLSVFKDMSTFIDIKDYLPKLNAPEENQLLEALSQGQSPKKSTLISASKIQVSKEGLYSHAERLKEIKKYLEEVRKENPKQIVRSQDQFQYYLLRSEEHFKQQESETHLPKFFGEKLDENAFYNELEVNLRKNKFDKINYEIGRVDDANYGKYLENLKKILEEEGRDKKNYIESQRTQLKVFKDRSDKVINMLKRATKNIFKKSLPISPKKSFSKPNNNIGILSHRRVKSEALIEGFDFMEIKETEDPKMKHHTEDDLRSKGVFLTETYKRIQDDGVSSGTFKGRIDSIKKRVHSISHLGQNEYGAWNSKSELREHPRLTQLKNKAPDYEINKKVNRLLGKCSQEILKEADTQIDLAKTYKISFGKLLDKVSLMYENDLAALESKPISELQLLDYRRSTKETFGNRCTKSKRPGKKGPRLFVI